MENPCLRRYSTRNGTTKLPNRLMTEPPIRNHADGGNSWMLRRMVLRSAGASPTPTSLSAGHFEATPSVYTTGGPTTPRERDDASLADRLGRRRLADPRSADGVRCPAQPCRSGVAGRAGHAAVHAPHPFLDGVAPVPD